MKNYIKIISLLTIIFCLNLVITTFATADVDLTDDINLANVYLPIQSVTPIGNGLCKVIFYDDFEGITYEKEVNEYLQMVANGTDHHLSGAWGFSAFEDEKYKYFVYSYETYEGNKDNYTDTNYQQVMFDNSHMIKMKDKFSFEPLLVEKYLAGSVKTTNEYNKYVQNQKQKTKVESLYNKKLKEEDLLNELMDESIAGGGQNIAEEVAKQEKIVESITAKYENEKAKVKIGPNEQKRLDEMEAEVDRIRAENDKKQEEQMQESIKIEKGWLDLASDYYKQLSPVKINDPEKNYFNVSDINENSCKTIIWYPYDTREKLTAYYKEKSDGNGIYYYSRNESGRIVRNYGYEILLSKFDLNAYYNRRGGLETMDGINYNLYDIKADRVVWADKRVFHNGRAEEEESFKKFFADPKNNEYPWGGLTNVHEYSIWGDPLGGLLTPGWVKKNPDYTIFDHHFVVHKYDGIEYYVEFIDRSKVDDKEYFENIVSSSDSALTRYYSGISDQEYFDQNKDKPELISEALKLSTIFALQKKEYSKLKFYIKSDVDKLNSEYQSKKPNTNNVIN